MTGLNDLPPDAAAQQVMDTALALANIYRRLDRCDFCGHLVKMQRSVVLGITLQRCGRCGCEGFCTDV